MKTLVIGLASTLILSGCVSSEDYKKLDARVSVLEARYYALSEDNNKMYDYLNENHLAVKKSIDNLKKTDHDLRYQVEEHDKTIKGWQQGIKQ